MRRWPYVALGIALLAGTAAALVVVGFDRFLDRNRDWVEARLEQALGRDVRFDALGLSVWGGLGAAVENLRVAGGPGLAQDGILEVESAQILIAPLPALLGRYHVREVVLVEPSATLARTPAGWSFERRAGGAVFPTTLAIRDGLVRLIDRTVSPAAELVVTNVDAVISGGGGPVSMRLAASILGADAQNVLVDVSVDALAPDGTTVSGSLAVDDVEPTALARALPALDGRLPAALEIDGPISLEATIDGLALGDGRPFSIAARLDAEQAALRVSSPLELRKDAGTPLVVSFDAESRADAVTLRQARLVAGGVTVDAAGALQLGDPLIVQLGFHAPATQIAELTRLVPALGTVGLDGTAEADLGVGGPIDRPALLRVDGTLVLDDVAGDVAGVPIVASSAEVTFEGGRAVLAPADCTIAGAPARITATLDGFAPPRPVTMTLALGDAPLDRLGGAYVRGRLDADLELAASAASGESFLESLRGKGTVSVVDGVLTIVNLAGETVLGLTGVPGVGQPIGPLPPRELPAVLRTRETRFADASASVSVERGLVRAEEIALDADVWSIRGAGAAGFDGAIDVEARLVLVPSVTGTLLGRAEEIALLAGAGQRQLEIPFEIHGRWPRIHPEPDAGAVARMVRRAALARGPVEPRDRTGAGDALGTIAHGRSRGIQRLARLPSD